MRTGLISLAVVASAAALPSPPTLNGIVSDVTKVVDNVFSEICEALPLEAFNTKFHHTPVPLEDAKIKLVNYKIETPPQADPAPSYHTYKAVGYQSGGTCANVRTRVEWDRMADSDKQKFVDGVKCLLTRAPSGQFPQAKNRYEDLVALHQRLTPNVHGNAKFLLWHRAFTALFERLMRNECGFNGPLPWFDETRYAGRFAQSSIFSSRWLGGIALGGQCVRDGQLANLVLNVGPGDSNVVHCLARNGDGSQTSNCNQEYVDLCARYPDYAGLSRCIELGYHAYGHNGVGAVMSDVQASVADPFFFLHHAFVDRTFRLYTNKNPQWLSQINGNDVSGNPLTLDTTVNTAGMMPDVRIRDILDTTGTTLCYKYDY
jgi:tyrosinase